MVKAKICPICKKEFAGKAALRQHMQAKHPVVAKTTQGGGQPRLRPLGNRRNRGRSSRGASQRVESGVDILDTRTVSAKAAAGTILFSLTLAVHELVGTRLQAVSRLWARWRPKMLQLEIVPSASSTTSGSYLLGWVAEPDYEIGSGIAAIRTVAAFAPSLQKRISDSCTFNIPCDTTQKWYLVDGTVDGETAHGAVFGILAAAVGNLTTDSSVSFSLRLRWTVEFDSARLPRDVEMENIYAEDDYVPYFTDSISNWADGKKLTLKHTEGGNAVPFPGAKPGVVYKLDSKAVLPYVKTSGNTTTTARISFGVRIPNYHTSAMAVFEAEDKAKKFAQTGVDTHCLDYVSAGEWVSPINPAWTQTSVSLAHHESVELARLRSENDSLSAKIHSLESKLDRLLQLADEGFLGPGPRDQSS